MVQLGQAVSEGGRVASHGAFRARREESKESKRMERVRRKRERRELQSKSTPQTTVRDLIPRAASGSPSHSDINFQGRSGPPSRPLVCPASIHRLPSIAVHRARSAGGRAYRLAIHPLPSQVRSARSPRLPCVSVCTRGLCSTPPRAACLTTTCVHLNGWEFNSTLTPAESDHHHIRPSRLVSSSLLDRCLSHMTQATNYNASMVLLGNTDVPCRCLNFS